MSVLQNTHEQRESVDLGVKGTIPHWVRGSLYRVGPGTWDIETKNGKTFTVGHWFDGLTQLHKFAIDGGTVSYRSRNVAEQQRTIWARDGGSKGITFGTEPCTGALYSSVHLMLVKSARSSLALLPSSLALQRGLRQAFLGIRGLEWRE